MKDAFNRAADICRTIVDGLNFRKGYGDIRLWKGINDAFTGYSALQLAFNVSAAGAAGLVSAPALFTGIGLAIAYSYGRR